jgi:hypothetical protein
MVSVLQADATSLVPLTCTSESQLQWNADERLTEETGTIVFTNQRTQTVLIYALDPIGRRKHRATIRPGGSFTLLTLRSQPWVVVERGGKEHIDRPISFWRLAGVDTDISIAYIA